jgi:hypothetical protein
MRVDFYVYSPEVALTCFSKSVEWSSATPKPPCSLVFLGMDGESLKTGRPAVGEVEDVDESNGFTRVLLATSQLPQDLQDRLVADGWRKVPLPNFAK